MIGAWARHALGMVPVVLAVRAAGVDLWFYALAAAYPARRLVRLPPAALLGIFANER